MGPGSSQSAAHVAFLIGLTLVLFLHFCRIPVLAPASVLHFKSIASEISLWHLDHPGSTPSPPPPALGMVPVFVFWNLACAAAASVSIYLDI